MRLRTCTLSITGFTLGATICLGTALVMAADLPHSGSFKIHSGWKTVGEAIQVAENHTFGTGNFWGISYSDTGGGPLHMGTAICSYDLDIIDGAGTGQGSCAWNDANGDKIFTSYSGKLSSSGSFDGMNKIASGTGKFDGIQGEAPFHCRALNDKGQYTCTQEFHYSLAPISNK